jgi:glycosyltransferase involved in cell wall biosynthesis
MLNMESEMSHKPLVSVVMIFLNAEAFIEEAIASVFSQTYDRWELFFVDDGSTDGSTDIAVRYAEQYSDRVFYLEHPGHENRGMSASRNLGISSAKGEYIALLDSDDVWLPRKLQEQVAILNGSPEVGMVYGSSEYWRSWTGNLEDGQRDYIPDLGVQVDELYEPPTLLTLLYPLGVASAPCPSDILLRREAVKHVGGFEESFRGFYEDQAFLTKVYLKERVFVASACWDRYRLHSESCSAATAKAGEYHSVRLLFLDWLAEYLSEEKVEDKDVWHALQEAQLHTSKKHIQILERRLWVRNKRLTELEESLQKEHKKSQRLRKQSRHLRMQVQQLDRALQSIQASKAWKLLSEVRRVRAKILGR